jgi:nucleotide-binding universal stress UspA family protein
MEEVVLGHVLQAVHTEGLDQLILNKQKEALEQLGIKVITKMPVGHEPARTLNDLAKEHNVSAILIGSHGKGILRSALLGSVTTMLLQEAERPVLLARIALLEEGKCHLVCQKMFTRVLFPTDFSVTAEHALNYLGKIAADTKCPVTIMHVLEREPTDTEVANSRLLLESIRKRLKSTGATDVNTDLASGEPVWEILDRAKEGAFSIIVMGSMCKGSVKEVFLGSVSNEVARHAELPVLLIPPVR